MTHLSEWPDGGRSAAEMCGDLLLVFSGETPTSARQRESPWVAEAQAESWTLWRQDVGPAWSFATVPSEFVAGRRLQIDYLKRHAPDLARITWQARDASLYWATRPDVLLLPKRAMKKLFRLVTGQYVIERNWEVQFLSDSGRAGLERWLLAPGLKLHDLVPRSKIVELLADFFREPFEAGRGHTVWMLLMFSAWLERYG